MALTGSTPAKAYGQFHRHIKNLLNQTITDAPLKLVIRATDETRAALFPPGGVMPVRYSSLFLYIGQNLVVKQAERGQRHLRTVRYRYIIQEGPQPGDRQLLRFDYVPPEQQKTPTQHPRHHVHISTELSVGKRQFNLARVHLPTGWVTIEELIRFIITELGVKAKPDDWDDILKNSEEKFREWTQREI